MSEHDRLLSRCYRCFGKLAALANQLRYSRAPLAYSGLREEIRKAESDIQALRRRVQGIMAEVKRERERD
jgi:hypothetical protein